MDMNVRAGGIERGAAKCTQARLSVCVKLDESQRMECYIQLGTIIKHEYSMELPAAKILTRGRCKMKQVRPKVKYIFVDPNTPREVQKVLKTMIVEKLLAVKVRN